LRNRNNSNRISIPDAQNYKCPSDKYGQYEDEVQCDKYYECRDGIAKERLCPDGLVFDTAIRKVNKCDQPFNVDCGDRTELRKLACLSRM
jgi:Chitin binding Peritrophin-A domain